MRVRVKFAKYGPMKFIGHLELMRYLQSAVRRTEIPVKYDEGMHQRMVMSFAMPLGVGPISSAEYMDIELEAPISTEKAMKQLGEHMCEGLKAGLKEFCSRESIPWVKETKKGTREVDMRSWIYDWEIRETSPAGTEPPTADPGTPSASVETSVYLRLCCSVGDNLKPEQLFGEMFRSYGHELPPFALQVHRLDLLTADEESKHFISLGDLGSRIP